MRDHPRADGIRITRRGALASVSALALLVVALLVGRAFVAEGSKRHAFAKYRAIQSGMTPLDVQRLICDGRDVTMGDVGNGQVYHIDGRYVIVAVYGPNPKSPTPARYLVRPNDDWVVIWKSLSELGRGGQFDDALVGLRLKPQRIVEVDRP